MFICWGSPAEAPCSGRAIFARVTPIADKTPPTIMEIRIVSAKRTEDRMTPKAGTRLLKTAVRDGPIARIPW